jgi:hypothetical protein
VVLSIFRRWASRAFRLPPRASAGLLCASLLLGAGCDDAFGPRPRPTGIRPDTVPAGNQAAFLWYELQPRVVALGGDSIRVTIAVSGSPTQVQLISNSRGIIPLTRTSAGIYSTRVAASDIVFGYRTGDLRNTSTFVEVVTPTLTRQTAMTVNVRDATVVQSTFQSLSSRVQASTHVVNIRYDSLYSGEEVPPEVLRTFYQFFPDDYDFITVLEQVQAPDGFFYYAARNEVSGLGLQTFDRAETYGSPNQLQGIMHYANDADFDPAETTFIHELAHRWMNFSNLPNLRNARPHFPISTLARGITGQTGSDVVTGQPHVFRYQLTPNPNGTYAVTTLPDRPRTFNDFELYLMGLLPPDSVSAHVTFLNQDQANQLRPGGVLTGPTDTITVGEWVARDGVRTPAYPATQRTFRMAVIVLSRNALMTREELAFYNVIAQRAENETETGIPAIIATTRFTTLPFWAATGGRARLITRLRLNQPN